MIEIRWTRDPAERAATTRTEIVVRLVSEATLDDVLEAVGDFLIAAGYSAEGVRERLGE
jgi:hypothetical protein